MLTRPSCLRSTRMRYQMLKRSMTRRKRSDDPEADLALELTKLSAEGWRVHSFATRGFYNGTTVTVLLERDD